MGDLADAFERSVKGNAQLAPELDAALIESGRKIAGQVDEAVAVGGQDATKALYLVPHLMNVLREMYATPKARLDAGIGKEDTHDKLAEVRQLRKRPAPTKKRAVG